MFLSGQLECELSRLGSTEDIWPYRCCVSAVTRFRHGEGEWRTDPLPGWLLPLAGGAPWARCSTGSTRPMPALRWWAARKTSAPPPKTVPGVRTGPAILRGPWKRLLVGHHPQRFGWWILPWSHYREAHPSLVKDRGHLSIPLPSTSPRSPAQLHVINATLLRQPCLKYFRKYFQNKTEVKDYNDMMEPPL